MTRLRYTVTSFPVETWDANAIKLRAHIKQWVSREGELKVSDNMEMVANIYTIAIGYLHERTNQYP